MRFLNLTVENYGIFASSHHFDFTPSVLDPSAAVVLVRGHNGAGKSTLFKAFSLALYGPLSMGDRVSAAQYQQLLYSRLHRHRTDGSNKTIVANTGRIALNFEFIRSGEPVRVRIERCWHREGRVIREKLHVLENGKPPEGIFQDDLQHYIGDLIPPGIAPLCFFDAERLDAPPLGTTSRESTLSRTEPLVRDGLRRLLGLDLVERLQTDLDLYLAKQGGASGKIEKFRTDVLANQKLVELHTVEIEALEAVRDGFASEQERLRVAILQQERLLAAEGGTYSARRPKLHDRLGQMNAEIAALTQQIEELCAHLLPFALATDLCRKLSERLSREAELQREAVAGELWRTRQVRIMTALANGSPYADLGLSPETQLLLTERLLSLVHADGGSEHPASTQIVHPISEGERERLQSWIAEVLYALPEQIVAIGSRLEALNKERDTAEADLKRVPDDAILAPIHGAIMSLQSEVARTRQRQSETDEKIGAARYQREEADRKRQKAADSLETITSDARRSQLAIRTRVALRAYREALLEQRVGELERTFSTRFNELCHKNRLLSSVSIDPETFSVTLLAMDGHELDIASFSAGEQQLYHLSLLRALREVSGRDLPLAIDTPVARLDDLHRERIIAEYIPAVSHQVLLFGTDVELNEEFLRSIGSNVARCYNLSFDPEIQSTTAQLTPLMVAKI